MRLSLDSQVNTFWTSNGARQFLMDLRQGQEHKIEFERKRVDGEEHEWLHSLQERRLGRPDPHIAYFPARIVDRLSPRTMVPHETVFTTVPTSLRAETRPSTLKFMIVERHATCHPISTPSLTSSRSRSELQLMTEPSRQSARVTFTSRYSTDSTSVTLRDISYAPSIARRTPPHGPPKRQQGRCEDPSP